MLDRLYSRTLALAASRSCDGALAAISFAESSFFPLPPDILLIPMILAQPRRAWLIAAVCTVASVLGGFLGYAIGYFLFDAIGRPVLEFYHAMGRYDALKAGLRRMGRVDHRDQGADPDPLQADHDRQRRRTISTLVAVRARLARVAQPAVFSARGAVVVVRRHRSATSSSAG